MQRCGMLACSIFLVPHGRDNSQENLSPRYLLCFTRQCRCEGAACPASKNATELMHQAIIASTLQLYP